MRRRWMRLRALWQRLWEDRRGAVAMMVALALVPLALASGFAIDLGRGMLVRSELGRATDTAALAAGTRADAADLQRLVQRYLDANFRGREDVVVDEVRVQAEGNGGRIVVTTRARVATTLLRVAQVEWLPVTTRTVVVRATQPMEVALVLDVTGSMRCCGKIQALRRSAEALVNILFAGEATSRYLRIGLVPFNARVNVGEPYRDWLVASQRGGPWNGCLEARSAANALSDAPPSVERFRKSRTGRGGGWGWWGWWRPRRGVTAPCPQARVLPLSATRARIVAAIRRLSAGGTTRIDMGARWGWRLLSERWRGLWLEDQRPTPREDVIKAMVLITDGQNVVNRRYDEVASRAQADRNLLTLCRRIREQGILLYTVTFGASTGSERLMQECATSPAHYFASPTNADLERAFRTIAGELSALRIAE